LDLMHSFCEANCMTVNVGKSEVVVFNSRYSMVPLNHQWIFNGAALTRSTQFKYLGLVFADGDQHMRESYELAMTRGRAAMFAFMQRCNELGVYNVAVKCHLFSTLVMPVMSYGCELWAP
ncbi:MAG TPA: hypothetical protein VEB42_08630, partial [Chitinophagaceae bacterium]|nr:hypothetical protein [Chitinophagaceae bacterium]